MKNIDEITKFFISSFFPLSVFNIICYPSNTSKIISANITNACNETKTSPPMKCKPNDSYRFQHLL